MSIKYYQLAKDEALPDEFCAVSDVGGEPSEYTFYVPESEAAKLRELVSNCHGWLAVNCEKGYVIPRNGLDAIEQSMRELGMEVGDVLRTE